MRFCVGLALALSGLLAPAASLRVGPPKGALVVVGGGNVGPSIIASFADLAGGKESPVVIIPTASDRDSFDSEWLHKHFLAKAGFKKLTVLHTRDRKRAESKEFVKPLLTARAVWFDGGRQWRLVDSYLHTRTHKEIVAVLKRGGVVGGSSAGATIQGSYLVRGARSGNTIMMAPGYEEGMALLKNVAIDQHLLKRNRENDMLPVIERHPHLLGIGIDESTAIVVQGDAMRVVGDSKVAIYDAKTAPDADGKRYYFLSDGDTFDLAHRRRQ